MKKRLLIGLLSLTVAAQADFLRIGAGYDNWKPDIEGSISNNVGLVETTKDMNESNDFAHIWADIKHPIPVIPNIRVERTNRDYRGLSTVSGSLTWGGINFPVSSNVVTTIDIKETDIIPYYNVLDNTFWLTLNLGVDFKQIDASIVVNDGLLQGEERINEWLPLGYVGARVNIPGTDIGIEGNVKYISYKNSKFSDTMIKIDYNVFKGVTAEVGYKTKQFVFDGADFDQNEIADFKEKGYFFGLAYRF